MGADRHEVTVQDALGAETLRERRKKAHIQMWDDSAGHWEHTAIDLDPATRLSGRRCTGVSNTCD